MRILIPSIVDPVTSRSGAGTVTRSLVRVLESPELRAEVECLPIRPPSPRLHRLRQAVAVARALGSSLPAKAAYTYSTGFRDRVLRRLNGGRFDLVILNGSDLLWLEPVLPASIPRLLIAHNIEHLLFEAQAAETERAFRLLGPALRRERRRMERFEASGIRAVGNVLFLSSLDAAHPRAGALATRKLVTPPLFTDPPCTERPRGTGPLEIGFLGNMAWWPNRRGLTWFLSDVFPHVDRHARLHLFGEGTQRYARGNARVSRHGPVDDLAEVWSRCDLMVCPMLAGGGVSTKLAEAVYHGIPVLATSLATRGLPLADDPGLVVSDRAAEWIEHLTATRSHAAGRISPSLSSRFAADTHRPAVQRFVREIVC